MCQEGVNRVSWHAHGIEYCNRTPGSCPLKPAITPPERYVVGPWTAASTAPMACVPPPSGMPKVTVGMLSRKETETLVNTLETYDKSGFLQVWAGLGGFSESQATFVYIASICERIQCIGVV